MAQVKKEVNGWELSNQGRGESKWYEYTKKYGRYEYTLIIEENKGGWLVMAMGGSDADQYGGDSTMTGGFREAKKKAYNFMRNFSTGTHYSTGYNDVVDAAERSGWHS